MPKAFLIWLGIHVVFSPGVEHLVDGWNRGSFPSVIPIQRQPETSAVYPDLRTVNTFLRGCVKLGALENAEAGPFRVGGLLGGGGGSDWPSRGRPFFLTRPMCSEKMAMSGILRTCKDIFLEVST